ncbi:MAG: hypothetical protein QG603_602 [Patescibacteria group bacterium]|nr:hypothetical protein [Patescibacteria group bacterium]
MNFDKKPEFNKQNDDQKDSVIVEQLLDSLSQDSRPVLQADETLPSIDEVLTELNNKAEETLINAVGTDAKTRANTEQRPVPSIYFNQLDATAEVVKKAIRSFNWRSFWKLSQKEKENLCAQIDKIVTDTQISVNDQYQGSTDVTKISRAINESRYQIQKIADDRHIKIPEEY